VTDSLETKRCAYCGSYIPVEATMCAGCGTSDPNGRRGGNRPPRRVSVIASPQTVTSAIVWANVLMLLVTVYVQFRVDPQQNVLSSLVSLTGLGPALYGLGSYSHGLVFGEGQWWRAFTAVYLHAGLIHIGFNMLAMRNLGRVVESLIGPWRLLVLYTLSGLGSTMAISIWHGVGPGDPRVSMVGASGAVFGVAGALAVLAFRAGTVRGQFLGRMLVRDIALMLVLGFLIRYVSNTGHIGGLLVGVLVAIFIGDSFRDRIDPDREHAWRAVALVCAAVTVLALALGILNAYEWTGGGR